MIINQKTIGELNVCVHVCVRETITTTPTATQEKKKNNSICSK